jgi:hypothetical protein
MLRSLNVGQKRSDACAIVDGMNKSSMLKEGSSIAPNSVVIRSARRFFEGASPESRADGQPAALPIGTSVMKDEVLPCTPYLRTTPYVQSSPARLASIARSQPTRWLLIRPTGRTTPHLTNPVEAPSSPPFFLSGPVRHGVPPYRSVDLGTYMSNHFRYGASTLPYILTVHYSALLYGCPPYSVPIQ